MLPPSSNKGCVVKVDLVIFDCDGVIADSEILSAEVLIQQLAAEGLALSAEDVRRDFLGRSFPTVAETIRRRHDRALPPGFEADYRSRLLSRFETELRPTPGFARMIEALDRPVCVATSSSRPRVNKTLEILGLTAFFNADVFTASQVERGKPAPDLFLFAARRMGVPPPACLVVEDSAPGLQAAAAAGMPHLHYTGGSHLSGAGPGDGPTESFDNWADFAHLLTRLEEGEARP